MDTNLLTCVVPIYNEAGSLPSTLEKLLPYCEENNYRLVFVDDGSTDNSGSILKAISSPSLARIITHKVNKGYGGALKTGISFTETPFLVTFDADGQHDPEDIKVLLNYLVENDADLVVGSRKRNIQTDKFRSTGKTIIRSFASLLMPIPITDLNSGMKIYRTDLVQRYATVVSDTMAFSDMITLVFINQKHRVMEHPINISERQAGKSTVNLGTAFDTLINILNITMLFNPFRVFLFLSMLFLIAGLVWGLPIIFSGRGVSVGSLLFLVTSLLFFSLGLLASQLAEIRLKDIRNPHTHDN